jgi:hypothetical protein
MAGADHYDLWVSDLTTGAILHNAAVTGTSFRFDQALVPGDSYRFWVRDIDGTGYASAWSSSLDFTAAAVPAPTPLSPTGTDNGKMPTFSWTGVAGADHYDLWVNDLTTADSPVLREADVTGTSFTFGQELAPGHSYRFWVRTLDATGYASAWSTALDFAVAPVGVPVLNGPSASASATPTFTWSAVAGADHYAIWVDDLSTGKSQVLWDPKVTNTSWTGYPLHVDATYRWWVRTFDAAGYASAWSAAQDFSVDQAVDPSLAFENFVDSLNDPGLADGVRAWTLDDGVLSRTDVLNLLYHEESYGTVSAGQLADLQAIDANAGLLNMPEDVANLLGKVVGDNPANAMYKGNSLGDLAPGSSAGQLSALVDKWFFGGDLPVAADGTTYVYAQGSLYGPSGVPQYTDVAQGWSADCYFLASLAEIAHQNAGPLQNHFIDNGDGTYTIGFNNVGSWDYVTINRMLPATNNGDGVSRFAYANTGQDMSNTDNVLWVALYEKAFVQLSEEGWSRGPGQTNAYTSIDYGDMAAAMNQVAGVATQNGNISDANVYSMLTDGVASGQWVVLGSKLPEPDPNVVGGHAYAVLGYDANTQLFTLYNPWGSPQQISWSDIQNDFDSLSFTV